MMTSVRLRTNAKTIELGEILMLTENVEGNASGGGFLLNINSSESASTNINCTGELTIIKLDFDNNIVSGTFWFNIAHPVTGETVEIREGRFDTLFTE